jgi:hypothetical protein
MLYWVVPEMERNTLFAVCAVEYCLVITAFYLALDG